MTVSIVSLRDVWGMFNYDGDFSIEANLYQQGKHCFFTLHQDILKLYEDNGGTLKVYISETEVQNTLKERFKGVKITGREDNYIVGYLDLTNTKVVKINQDTLFKSKDESFVANPRKIKEQQMYFIESQK